MKNTDFALWWEMLEEAYTREVPESRSYMDNVHFVISANTNTSQVILYMYSDQFFISVGLYT